jgi:iron(III) transport system ATP-binding protein
VAAYFVELRGVTKEFPVRGGPPVRAVDNVSLVVEPGEFITLLGPSGCGKTTLLRLIGGFEVPSAGEVLFDGRRVTHLPPNRRDTAMVFQNYALFPHMNVFENVAYSLRVRGRVSFGEVRRRVEAMLDLVGLSGLGNRPVGQLSGGQQQRVALARALIKEPKVLLFDEPLSNLDAKLRLQMRGELRRVQRQTGITSIYVTHDQEEAMSLSDRVAVLQDGRVHQIGPPWEVYERPRTRFVAEFVGRQANFLSARVCERRGGRATVEVLGRRIAVAADVEAAGPITAMIRPEAVDVRPIGGGGWDDSEARGDGLRLRGRIAAATYLGGQVLYDIELAPGAGRLTAEVSDPRRRGLLPVGTEVEVGFAADSLHLIPN